MSKKTILRTILVSGIIFAALFIKCMVDVLGFIRHPLSFNFTTLFGLVGVSIALFVHAFLYVHFMDYEKSKFTIEDDENWWEKWDRV